MPVDHCTTAERWVDAPGFPGYQVSDRGRVQTRRHRNGLPAPDWRDLTPVPDGKGYPQVRLYRPGEKPRWVFVSRLVLEAFAGPCPPGTVARHVTDPAPTNCHLWNLAWGTQADNCRDKERHGTAQKGEKHPRAKLTMVSVVQIRKRVAAGESIAAVHRDYPGITYSTLYSAVRGWNWHDIGQQIPLQGPEPVAIAPPADAETCPNAGP